MSVRPPSSPSPLPLVRRCRRRWRRRLLRSFSSILPFPSCPPPLRPPLRLPPSPRPQSFSQLNWLAPLLSSSSPLSIPLAESRTDGRTSRRSRSSSLDSLDRDCPNSPPNLTCTRGRKERAGKKTNGIGRKVFPHRRQNAKTPTVTRKRTGKRSGFAHELEKPHLFTCGCGSRCQWFNGRGLLRRTDNGGGSSTRGPM